MLKNLYACKENDNNIRAEFVDDDLDELWFSDALKRSWTIIGKKDLEDALLLYGYKIQKVKEN